jgi:hypothetical protein
MQKCNKNVSHLLININRWPTFLLHLCIKNDHSILTGDWPFCYIYALKWPFNINRWLTFLKTRIKATDVWLLATSVGHLKYWRYGKTREFRDKYPNVNKEEWLTFYLTYIMSETRHGYKLLFDCIHCIYVIQWYIESCKMLFIWK